MVFHRTILKSADNTGAKRIYCISVLKRGQKKYAQIGDIISCSIKEAEPHSQIKKKDKVWAVVVRQRKEFRRTDGTYIRFDDNAAVIIDKNSKDKEPKGTRIFGPVARELKERGFKKIISMAPEVV